MRDVATLGGVDLINETIKKGTTPESARKWWAGELSGHAAKAGVELIGLKITPNDVARIDALVQEGNLTDKLARQVIEAVLNGEGSPDDVIAKRNL